MRKVLRALRRLPFIFASKYIRKNSFPIRLLWSDGTVVLGSWNTVGRGFWHDGRVDIGNFCSIGPNVSCIGTRHCFRYSKGNHRYLKTIGINDDIIDGEVKIGDNVFIGRNAIILHNVQIGNNVIVGAGAVVTKNVPGNSIIAGNPAQIIGKRDDLFYL